MNFFPDFAPNSRKEWRVSLFNQICENKLEICRKFWIWWKLFNIIQNYSLVSLITIHILRSQLRWLGHILRREPTDPLRLVVFEPNTALLPRLTGTGRIKVVGRPRIDWAQTLIEIFCNFARCSRNDLLNIVLDKQSYHTLVERLCSQAARDQQWRCVSLFL